VTTLRDLPLSQPSEASEARRAAAAADARAARRGLLTALLLSAGAHAIAIGALAGVTFSGGRPASSDSPPIPIRIYLAPAAGGGADGAARDSGPPAVPGDAGAAQPEPAADAELVVDAASPEPVAPPAPTTPPAPQPDVARWLLEVLADQRKVVSTPAYDSPQAPAEEPQVPPPAPAASEPVATTDAWQGPPAPAPQVAKSRGVRPPDIGLFGDGDGFGAGYGAADGGAGHGGGEGGGIGTGVGPGPGGREGGTGLFPVPLGGNVAPEYPLAARQAGEEGLVVIHAQVLADGSVADAQVGESSGYERLDDAALAAVRHWRFQPALHDGQAVAQSVDVPIRFRLRAR
jgi:protein TonB